MEQDHSVQLDNSRTLWLTEISSRTFYDQGLEDLESDAGLFIALENITDGTFTILAKAASVDTGLSLLEMFGSHMALHAA